MGTTADLGATRRELVSMLAACPLDGLDELVASYGHDLVARLLPVDWEDLLGRVRRGDGSLPGRVGWRAGHALHQFGRYDAARAVLADTDPTGLAPAEHAQLLGAAAATAWAQGRTEDCRRFGTEAMALAERTRDDAALASAWLARALLAATLGDRSDNRSAYAIALEHAEAAGDLLGQVRILNNLGSADLEEARFREAAERLGEALRLHESLGHLPMLALLRHNMAETMLGLGRLDEALVEAEASRAAMAQVDSPWNGSAWQLTGDIQAARGNLTQASHAYAEAWACAEAEGDAQSLVPAMAGAARTQVAVDPGAALEIVERMMRQPASQGHVVGVLVAGWIHLHRGDTVRALFYAQEAMTEASRRREQHHLADGLELAVLASTRDGDDPRLHEALGIWDRTGDEVRRQTHLLLRARLQDRSLAEQVARQQLRRLGVHDDAWGMAGPLRAVHREEERVAAVRVHGLGSFTVTVDGAPVGPGDWPGRKAKDVLRILCARGGRGISRDELCELVWPDTPGTGNRLSIALSHLRTLLDPGKQHGPDRFIEADRFTVRLNPAHVDNDVDVMREACAEAMNAHRRGDAQAVLLLEAAAATYTGDFAVEDAQDPVTFAVRDELRVLGQQVSRALAQSLTASGDPDRAVPWLARLLAEDPYDEPTYRQLIGLLVRQRRLGEARRYYATYELRMGELDADPEPWESMSATA